METNKKIEVDREKIERAIRMGVPLSITSYTIPREIEDYVTEVLTLFLELNNLSNLKDYLSYSINELATNAKKANTKRVFFKEKNLDINDPDDYEKGMEAFKNETLRNINYYLNLQKNEGLYIKFIFHRKGNSIIIEIRNNSEMTEFEFKRVFDKIARSRQFFTLEEAIKNILDDTEGAGLGLVIMILMLKKIGFSDEHYDVLIENGETISRLTLPIDIKIQDQVNELSNEILKYIETLPKFPDNIAQIEKLLNDPDSKLSDIAMHISNDVSLTADLLKLVNSAAFSLSKKCTNISEAVKLIGIRGIKNLLLSVGALKVLDISTDEQKKLWDHSHKAAFFSYNLAKNFLKNKLVTEDAYVCGLLHDIGKIAYSSLYPESLAKIDEVRKKYDISQKIFNALISGHNHTEIGARLAEKWNYPPTLVNAIRYHHDTSSAPEEYYLFASTVCLADLIIHYLDKKIEFYQIDNSLLELYSIKDEQQLERIAQTIQHGFEQELNKTNYF